LGKKGWKKKGESQVFRGVDEKGGVQRVMDGRRGDRSGLCETWEA